jgi:hypothetical protein
MKRTILPRLAGLSLATWLMLALPAHADPLYQLNNYPALQNGWTLTGSITTDGTIGTLTTADIVAWQWTVTQGNISLSFSSTDQLPNGEYAYAVVNNVVATSDALLLATTWSNSTRNDLALISPLGGGSSPLGLGSSIAWEFDQEAPIPSFNYVATSSAIPGQAPNTSASLWGDGLFTDTPLTIATVQPVPELSSLAIAGFSVVILIGYAWYRR